MPCRFSYIHENLTTTCNFLTQHATVSLSYPCMKELNFVQPLFFFSYFFFRMFAFFVFDQVLCYNCCCRYSITNPFSIKFGTICINSLCFSLLLMLCNHAIVIVLFQPEYFSHLSWEKFCDY